MSRSRELRRTITRWFGDLPGSWRDSLERAPNSAHTTSDTAACLLGRDLWISPLADYRDRLIESGERPHLWTFEFDPSRMWNVTRWNALSLQARIVRARTGSLDRQVITYPSAWALQMDRREFNKGLFELMRAGFSCEGLRGAYVFEPLATPEELHLDLALIEIIGHWFIMLAQHDRVLDDPHPTGFEVHGYNEACSACRARWGLRERDPQWVPPFHPGCRCFSQPRFT